MTRSACEEECGVEVCGVRGVRDVRCEEVWCDEECGVRGVWCEESEEVCVRRSAV